MGHQGPLTGERGERCDDLNDAVPPSSFLLVAAVDINEAGVIIGHGFHGPVWGPSRGFILLPSGRSR